MIFTPVHDLRNLEITPNLRSLTCEYATAECQSSVVSHFYACCSVINTGLVTITDVTPVRLSLLRLCLTEQHIDRIPALDLPNLRDLLLHNNRITAIENLRGCPKVQRLWLHCNDIVKIENLDPLGDLRELWLQNNRISRISGVEHLVNLQVRLKGY